MNAQHSAKYRFGFRGGHERLVWLVSLFDQASLHITLKFKVTLNWWVHSELSDAFIWSWYYLDEVYI